MARPTPLSGFPEWRPAGRIVESHVLDVLRSLFDTLVTDGEGDADSAVVLDTLRRTSRQSQPPATA